MQVLKPLSSNSHCGFLKAQKIYWHENLMVLALKLLHNNCIKGFILSKKQILHFLPINLTKVGCIFVLLFAIYNLWFSMTKFIGQRYKFGLC